MGRKNGKEKRTLSIAFNAEELAKLDALADKEDRSRSSMINQILKMHFAMVEKETWLRLETDENQS